LRSTRFSLAVVALLALVGAAQAIAAKPAGEPFFPRAGSHDYDVADYTVRLAYEPEHGGRVSATVRIIATANGQLDGFFSLDFVGPRVTGVQVGGRAVEFEREGAKLGVYPDRPIPTGREFTTTVRYRGVPPKVTDADGTEEGWYPTDDGVIAVGEPQGTAAWIPCNNVPWDKATFLFEVDVPARLRAVANGRQEPVERSGNHARYTWWERAPMSPYLAMLNVGRGQIVKGQVGKIPTWTLVDPRLRGASPGPLAALPEVIRFEAGVFGDYPFESAGSVVDYAPRLGYALESQSRPIYAYVPDVTTIVHETAHQWFGDSVGLERWPQIWLNEGFATWTQWYYAERHGGRSAEEIFKRLSRVPASDRRFWNPPPARLGRAKDLFDPTVYVRGAMAVQALREKIGTGPLLRVLRRWTSEHRHGSATIDQFTDLAEEVGGRELDNLFQRWLYQRGKP
jgi:aminopeptidase N